MVSPKSHIPKTGEDAIYLWKAFFVYTVHKDDFRVTPRGTSRTTAITKHTLNIIISQVQICFIINSCTCTVESFIFCGHEMLQCFLKKHFQFSEYLYFKLVDSLIYIYIYTDIHLDMGYNVLTILTSGSTSPQKSTNIF